MNRNTEKQEKNTNQNRTKIRIENAYLQDIVDQKSLQNINLIFYVDLVLFNVWFKIGLYGLFVFRQR